jgi:ATP:ADP antiporter, AAA family
MKPLNNFLARFVRIEAHETRTVSLGVLLIFFVLGGYFCVRPVRETIGTVLGREATQDLWLWTAIVALIMVPFYGWLVAHVRRAVLLPCIYGVMVVAFIGTASIIGDGLTNKLAASCFYVGISVANLLLVSVFWSYMLEILNSEQSKRLIPIMAAGGTAGALIGPAFTKFAVPFIGNVGVLLTGAGAYIAAIVIQRALAHVNPTPPGEVAGAQAANARDKALGGNPFAGFMLVLRNPYLAGIALFIVGISAINTFLYFEQLEVVEKQFESLTERTAVFAYLDTIVQLLVILSQVFLTGRIATKFGVTALLVTVPLVMVAGLTVFAFWDGFMILAISMVIRRWGEYAFVRPGREMLFSKVDRESKYKAKNLCDVAVYRVADAGFAQLKKILDGAHLGGMIDALIAAGVAALWALNGWWLGRRHEKERGDIPNKA